MTIKVTMPRQVIPGQAYELYELLVELRIRALKGTWLSLWTDPGSGVRHWLSYGHQQLAFSEGVEGLGI